MINRVESVNSSFVSVNELLPSDDDTAVKFVLASFALIFDVKKKAYFSAPLFSEKSEFFMESNYDPSSD